MGWPTWIFMADIQMKYLYINALAAYLAEYGKHINSMHAG